MNSEDEKRLRANWGLLAQDLRVEDFVGRFVEMGVLTAHQREGILGVSPAGRGDKFLQAVLQGGSRAYQNMCNIILEMNDPKYQKVVTALDILRPTDDRREPLTRRSSTGLTSVYSLDSGRGESVCNASEHTGRLESARQPWRMEPLPHRNTDLEPEKAETEVNEQPTQQATSTSSADEIVKSAVAKVAQSAEAACGESDKGPVVDMEALEKELMGIAPTIADLFTKISKQTKQVTVTSQEELQKVKEDNERLRKTNKNLIEKLNTFQSKIIQLQLENKRLKDFSDTAKQEQQQLKAKSSELDGLKNKLEEQKHALEEKERELDQQIQKINGIVQENEEQKQMIRKLEALHEEGMLEFEIQQDQLTELMEEKERQKEQIEQLVENQKQSEQLFLRMEERLLMLERGDTNRRNRQRQFIRGMNRTPWTGAGAYEKSHHASVKFPPDSLTKGKGWSV